jgi:hypothetical protein
MSGKDNRDLNIGLALDEHLTPFLLSLCHNEAFHQVSEENGVCGGPRVTVPGFLAS